MYIAYGNPCEHYRSSLNGNMGSVPCFTAIGKVLEKKYGE